MTYFKNYKQLGVMALAVFSLCACGGSNSSAPISSPNSSTGQSAISYSCSGAVKDLFVSMQGTYRGVVDPAFVAGAGAPLTVGTVYPVTLSGQDCSIRFIGNNGNQFVFAYNDPNNKSLSKLVGFSPQEILRQPDTLDLKKNQYNVSISGANNKIELERRIEQSDSKTVNGDLHLYAIPGQFSFGGMSLKLDTKY